MSNPPAREPVIILICTIIGIAAGICLAIIIALFITLFEIIFGDWPSGQPSWAVIERGFALGVFYYGLMGVVVGGIVGICIGFTKWNK